MFVRHGDAHVAQDVQARLVIAVGDEPGDFFEDLFDLLRRRLPHDADLLPGDQVGADPARDGGVDQQVAGQRSRIGRMSGPRPGPAHPAVDLRFQRRRLRVIPEIALAAMSVNAGIQPPRCADIHGHRLRERVDLPELSGWRRFLARCGRCWL